MATLPLGTYTACIAQGDYLYLTNSLPSQLLVLDISDPENLAVLVTLTLPVDNPTAIQIYTGLCYIACSDNVLIVNVDDPTTPAIERTIDLSGANIVALQVVGDIIFAAGDVILHGDNSIETDTPAFADDGVPGASVADIAIQGRRLYEVEVAGGALRSYRVGGFYCPMISTGSLDADEITTELLRARHGHFAGSLVASELMVTGGSVEADSGSGTFANYIKINDIFIFVGTGTPEGNFSGPIGSYYTDKAGGAGTTLYVKESGSGNTGWTAK